MRVKTILDEDFVNYKKASMFIGTVRCDGKCCREAGIPMSVCQNAEWHIHPVIPIGDRVICERYLGNSITSAIVFGGLEPFDQFSEMLHLIHILRHDYGCIDDVVIYTGYYPYEVQKELTALKKYENIIVKFGRYVPNSQPVFDSLLGIRLASNNQFAQKIS